MFVNPTLYPVVPSDLPFLHRMCMSVVYEDEDDFWLMIWGGVNDVHSSLSRSRESRDTSKGGLWRTVRR